MWERERVRKIETLTIKTHARAKQMGKKRWNATKHQRHRWKQQQREKEWKNIYQHCVRKWMRSMRSRWQLEFGEIESLVVEMNRSLCCWFQLDSHLKWIFRLFLLSFWKNNWNKFDLAAKKSFLGFHHIFVSSKL